MHPFGFFILFFKSPADKGGSIEMLAMIVEHMSLSFTNFSFSFLFLLSPCPADRDGLIEMLAMNVEHMALSFGRDWWEC